MWIGFGRWSAGGQCGHRRVRSTFVEWHSRLGGELRRFQHYRGEPLAIHRLAPGHADHSMGGQRPVTVYFIGAGPGAADLITVRAQRLLRRCPVCLYAGSIMPDRESADLLDLCPPGSRIVNTGPLTLEDIVDEIAAADAAGHDVARLHPAILRFTAHWRSNPEGSTRLGSPTRSSRGAGIRSSGSGARSGTDGPGVAQTVTLTRVATLSTAMPNGEDLTAMPGTLVIHLAAHRIDAVVAELLDSGRRPGHPGRGGRVRQLARADGAAWHVI